MYNIKNPDRLDFIRKIRKERGINEIFSIEDTKRNDVVEIGNNVKIKDGTVIGTDGWGYERNEKLELDIIISSIADNWFIFLSIFCSCVIFSFSKPNECRIETADSIFS